MRGVCPQTHTLILLLTSFTMADLLTSSALHAALSDHGSAVLAFEDKGTSHRVRFYQAEDSQALSHLKTLPAHDEEKKLPCDKLRHRLRAAFGVTASSAQLLHGLAVVHGYTGPVPPTAACGLRLLLAVPEVDKVDRMALASLLEADDVDDVPVSPFMSSPTAVPVVASDRIDRLEATLLSLTHAFQALQTRGFPTPNAHDQAPASHNTTGSYVHPSQSTFPPTAVPRQPTNTAMNIDSASPSEPPTWQYKSTHRSLPLLGQIYEHLLHTAPSLATALLEVKDDIDYRFLPPQEVSGSEDNEHTYRAKHSGKRWDTSYPPPQPCYDCHQLHWRADCPQKRSKEERSGPTFPRGHPPGRYYVYKTGKTYNTRRKPQSDCNKCPGKQHWFWSCPRAGDTIHTPKGSRFTDDPDAVPSNKSGARYHRRQGSDTAPSDASSSDLEDVLPSKRAREHTHRKPLAATIRPAAPSNAPNHSFHPFWPSPPPPSYPYPFWGQPPAYPYPSHPSASPYRPPVFAEPHPAQYTQSPFCPTAASGPDTQPVVSCPPNLHQPTQAAPPPPPPYSQPHSHQPYASATSPSTQPWSTSDPSLSTNPNLCY